MCFDRQTGSTGILRYELLRESPDPIMKLMAKRQKPHPLTVNGYLLDGKFFDAVTQVRPGSGGPTLDVDETMLDYAVRIGTTAQIRGIKGHQMEQLMVSLDSIPDKRLALLVTAIFAMRQAERKQFNAEAARIVSEAMKYLYETNRDVDSARVLLGLAKWVYEASEGLQLNRPVGSAKEFVNLLTGTRR